MHFEIEIQAPAKKVWAIMLEPDTYQQWTTAFGPTSYYEGSWEKGSRIRFLGAEGSGMVSEIAENKPFSYLSIKHLGMIRNGVEDTSSEDAKNWRNAFENYTFTEKGSVTRLEVDLNFEITPESTDMKEMFEGMWPAALLKLKGMCEKKE